MKETDSELRLSGVLTQCCSGLASPLLPVTHRILEKALERRSKEDHGHHLEDSNYDSGIEPVRAVVDGGDVGDDFTKVIKHFIH